SRAARSELNDEGGPRLVTDHAIGNQSMGALEYADGGFGEWTENTINNEGCTLRVEKVLHGPDGLACRAFLLKRPKHCYSPPKINSLSIALVHRLLNPFGFAAGQLAVFQGASEAPYLNRYGSSEQRGKTANWPRPMGLR